MFNSALLRVSLWASLAGFVASSAVHIAVLRGVAFGGPVYGLHIGIFVVGLPAVLAFVAVAKRLNIRRDDIRSHWRFSWSVLREVPAWQRVALGLAFGYATVNFVVAFPDATAGGADEILFQRIASGHWLAFYVLLSVLAAWLLRGPEPGSDAEAR